MIPSSALLPPAFSMVFPPPPPPTPPPQSPPEPLRPRTFGCLCASGLLRTFWICPFPATRSRIYFHACLFFFCLLSERWFSISVRSTSVPSKLPFISKHATQTKRKQAQKPLHRAGKPFPKTHPKSIFQISQSAHSPCHIWGRGGGAGPNIYKHIYIYMFNYLFAMVKLLWAMLLVSSNNKPYLQVHGCPYKTGSSAVTLAEERDPFGGWLIVVGKPSNKKGEPVGSP